MSTRNITTLSVMLSAMLLSTAVAAQTPTRVRGVISAVDGNTLSVKVADGKTVELQLGEKTQFTFNQPIKLSDIKQGDFLAITSARRADGTLTALEVRRFPKALNPGHRPFDGKDDQTMTNATVSAMVQSANGRELTMGYEGGSQKIVVPENISVSTQVAGERTQLKPGSAVNLTATPADGGKLVVQRIQVSPPGK